MISETGQRSDEYGVLGSVFASPEPMAQWAEIRQMIPHCLIFPSREGKLLAYALDAMMRDGVIPSLAQSITYLRQVPFVDAWDSITLGGRIANSGGMRSTTVEQQLVMVGEWTHGHPQKGSSVLDALGGTETLQGMVTRGRELKRQKTALASAVDALKDDYDKLRLRVAINHLKTSVDDGGDVRSLVSSFCDTIQPQDEGSIVPLESYESESRLAVGRGHQCASWGVDALDRYYPLARGKLYTLSAPPSHGKSTLALQAALATAGHPIYGGHPKSVLYLSLEMSGGEMLAKARLCHTALEAHGWDSSTAGICIQRPSSVAGAQYTINDVVANINFLHASSGGKLCLVVVDYIGKLDWTDFRSNENIELGRITDQLKKVALGLDIAVLQLAQMNREGRKEQRNKDGNVTSVPEPRMGDLRGSGKIEDDSDCILFLWPQETDRDKHTLKYVYKCAKYRCGPQINLEGFFTPSESYFDATDPHPKRSDV